MKEYEISINDKKLGKVKLFKDNLNKDIKNSLIISNYDVSYRVVNYNGDIQTYEVTFNINSEDDLYDIVSKYTYNNEIFNSIDIIKEYNNIKYIKKNTLINIILPEIYLNNLNILKDDTDLNSLFYSKIHFIKNVLDEIKDEEIIKNLNKIINNYNSYKSSDEYEFLTDNEKENNIKKFIVETNLLIKKLEDITNYKYGKDYIIPIKINRQ